MSHNDWSLFRSVAPTGPVLSVTELSKHLRITDDAEDALVVAYEEAVVGALEEELGLSLLPQTWQLRLDRFPGMGEIVLPRPPLVSVTSVSYVDDAGVSQTLSTNVYSVDLYGPPLPRIYLKYGEMWPVTRVISQAVTITYATGYASTFAVPPNIRAAIRGMVGDLFEHREGQITGTIQTTLPIYERLLASHRVYWEPCYG